MAADRPAAYRADVDGLRAVAVLAVVGYHLFPGVVRGGFVGVDVFFVISGFLISSVLLDDLEGGRPLFRRFYSRRVRRIFPALLALLFAVLAAGWLLLLPGEYARLGKHVAGSGVFAANLMFWSEAGYFDQAAVSKPLLHLWSLGVEEQFYLVWPVLLLVIWRRPRRVWLFSAVLLASFVLSLVTVRHDASAAFYSPVERFWELLSGAALAFAARDARALAWWRPQAAARNACSFAGVALVVAAVVRLNQAAVFPGWKVLAPVIGSALVIAAGSRAWLNRRVLALRPMAWIGLISYPLYLWHWPIYSFARIVAGELTLALRFTIGAASLGLAAATYWLVERPIRRRPATPALVFVLCAPMALVSVLGLTALRSNGWPQRLPPAVQRLASFSYDNTRDFRGHTCMLFQDQHERVLGPDCLDSDPSKANEIALWGDSHAAQLYRAVEAAFHDRFRVSQLTAGGCPPLFGDRGRWEECAAFNEAAFATIASRKPAIVVLGAEWIAYDWSRIAATITRLRAAGVGTVVVAGEVPVWDGPFPEILARLALSDRPRFRVPGRTNARLNRAVFDVDRRMAPLVRDAGGVYESALEILCTEEGCLTRAGDEVVTFDTSHLTPAGARYVVARFTGLGAR